MRVFTSETDHEVFVVVVPTPSKYKFGWTLDWTEADIAADLADVNATLAAPLNGRRIVNAGDGMTVKPLSQKLVDRIGTHPAPRLRPIGPLDQNDPLTFRGEL